MKCLYLTQELAPYFVEGGLGQTAMALPRALERDLGIAHDLVVPYYPRLVGRHGLETETVWRTPSLPVGPVDVPASVERLLGRAGSGDVFLVRADHWYDRPGLYRDEDYVEFADATARAAFFGACVARWLTDSGRRYDVVHGNDWQSGPALAHLRTLRGTDRTPVLLANVHSAAYTGRVEHAGIGELALPAEWRKALADHGDEASLLLLGLLAADTATTGSPTYARELVAQLTGTAIGAALDRLPLTGIVAGIDTHLWQPAATGRVTSPYTPDTVARGKQANKLLLQRRLGLKEDPDAALFGVCTRVVPEKGIDLLVEAAGEPAANGSLQLVVVGQGDASLVGGLAALARALPSAVAHVPRFDQDSAWLTYAGSDFTVMPSRVEPCGLNQLIAMTYGCLPVVSAVGGLCDTVTDITRDPAHGTGFILPELTADALRDTMLRAARWLAGPRDQVAAGRRRAMAQDWSWSRAARDTATLYARRP
ncbi:glycogen synthase 2 [Streptomyces hygroscopicus subsp. hygroscopicus]|nr:glycogen/starch synthase [Streptomyces hygroscopicus]GLX50935.1 glycogen synthase 2 [Streptomyces hygroscopicus subsp. hygroscopicus]